MQSNTDLGFLQYCARRQSAIDNVQAHNISTITYARYVRTYKSINAAHSLGTKFSNVSFRRDKEHTMQKVSIINKSLISPSFCHCFFDTHCKHKNYNSSEWSLLLV